MAGQGWIGVDLDGTLAYYDRWRCETHIGPPIRLMLDRVKAWLAEGKTVKIVTARVGGPDPEERAAVTAAVQAWCLDHVGVALDVTAAKDYGMIELWDDRCVQVVRNTGMRADGGDGMFMTHGPLQVSFPFPRAAIYRPLNPKAGGHAEIQPSSSS